MGKKFGSPEQGEEYLEELSEILHSLKRNPLDLVIYQAGADVHMDDPLGGTLTTEQMARRDRMVFQTCRDAKIPIAHNLAGGYQFGEDGSILPVLLLHEQTYKIAESVFDALSMTTSVPCCGNFPGGVQNDKS